MILPPPPPRTGLILTLFCIAILAIYSAGCIAAADPGPIHIGVLLPTSGPSAVHSIEGFRVGAKAYDPAVNVTVLHVGESFEGFDMPECAGELARGLRADGVDVILMIAGASNTGIVDAARETGDIYLIGEDTDQSYLAPDLVAASVVKEIDTIVYHAVENEIMGGFTPGQEVRMLANGGSGRSLWRGST